MSNSKKRELEGVVVRNKMEKTVIVEVKQDKKHPTFNKYYTSKIKYQAHDGKSECNEGDKVLIRESKPISKNKRWAVVKILEKQEAVV